MSGRLAMAAFDLDPGEGLIPCADAEPHTWRVTRHDVQFHATQPLPAGWYRLRLLLRSHDRHAVRKRLELLADGQSLDRFEWNRELREDQILQLPRDAHRLSLRLRHATGTVQLAQCDWQPTHSVRTAARALRLKFQLLSTYNCFWPVVRRGGTLLAQGQVREFGRRVLKGLGDSRTMRIEVKRATEASAAWWRRRALSAEEIHQLKLQADALTDPRPIGIIIPFDPTRVDHARQAMLSVYRQVYPHWQLGLLSTTPRVSETITTAARWDNRTHLFIPNAQTPFAETIRQCVDALQCDCLLVLPPDQELAEAALLRLAQIDSDSFTFSCSDTALSAVQPCLVPASRLRDAAPRCSATTAAAVVRWATQLHPSDGAPILHEPIAFPVNQGPTAAMAVARTRATQPLVLAADVRGISGWDHVAFALMKGLRSAGVTLSRHHAAQVVPDLLPPDMQPPRLRRTPEHAQLAIAPPFLLKRFALDHRSAVLTMWEADRIEPAYVAELNRAAVVIVPSRWGHDCFQASGVTAPLEIVPLGYDPLVFHPSLSTPDVCTFGTAGALSAGGLRKNVHRVITLFRQAFPQEADVRLRVKITPNCPPLELTDDPRVEVLRAALPYPDLATWNRSLSAYVNASFAEGFGFHLLEAMACGVPLISSPYSGLTAFFDERVGYTVPYQIVPADNAIYTGHWADPDDAGIIARMRHVYANRTEAALRGEAAAARARRFTWRDCGRGLLVVLRKYGLLSEPTA